MKKKITIGLFMDSYFPMIDGVTTVMDNYAKRLVKYANVIVFVPNIPGKPCDDSQFNYKIVRCKAVKMPIVDYSYPLPKMDREFMKELNNTELDIVHIHSPFVMGKLGIDYAKKHNIPVIATMHSQFKQDFQRAVKSDKISSMLTSFLIKQFNRCDECWAVNSEVANIYYNDYHYKEMPRVMNNATDMKLETDIKAARKIINDKHNLKDDETVFLFVGRINNLKNVFFLADSLKILKEKYKFKFKMLFVGSGQDEEKLKQIIKNNKMEKDIIMCGKVMDRDLLRAYYARADLFLFPSLYDASSIVQIEAASQKTPTLFIEGAATTATIQDNINGFLGKNDKDAYAKKIMDIMNDKKLYNKVCENAYKDVYVNWDDKIMEVYNLYLDFINNKK